MDTVIKSGTPVITSQNIVLDEKTAARAAERDRQLKKACADFEAVFAYYLFKSMRGTVPSSGLLDRYPGKETYTMMMDQKIAEELSQSSNGLGLKEMLYRQLSGNMKKSGEVVNMVTPSEADDNFLVSKD